MASPAQTVKSLTPLLGVDVIPPMWERFNIRRAGKFVRPHTDEETAKLRAIAGDLVEEFGW